MSSTYPRSPSASSPASYLAPREPIPPGRETETGVPLATTSIASRIFTYPVQRHRCAPRWRAISSRLRSAPFLSIWDFARITMPGMQNPHCKPPHAANASEKDWRSDSSTPSKVVISRPSALATGYWHETWALPSIMMVQQPHWPVGEHPSLGEVMSNSSRKAASKWGWSLATETSWPLTRKETRVDGAARSVIGTNLYEK